MVCLPLMISLVSAAMFPRSKGLMRQINMLDKCPSYVATCIQSLGEEERGEFKVRLRALEGNSVGDCKKDLQRIVNCMSTLKKELTGDKLDAFVSLVDEMYLNATGDWDQYLIRAKAKWPKADHFQVQELLIDRNRKVDLLLRYMFILPEKDRLPWRFNNGQVELLTDAAYLPYRMKGQIGVNSPALREFNRMYKRML